MSFEMEDVRCDATSPKKGEGKGGAKTSESAGIYMWEWREGVNNA
jgi:hypothetical protein